MKKTIHRVLAFAMIVFAMTARHADGLGTESPAGQVEIRTGYVRGFPMAIRLRVEGPAQLASCSPFGQVSPIRVQLSGPNGQVVVVPKEEQEVVPNPRRFESEQEQVIEIDAPKIDVLDAVVTEFVWDLSENRAEGDGMVRDKVTEGTWQLTTGDSAFPIAVLQGTTIVTAPNDAEAKLLARVGVLSTAERSRWMEFVRLYPSVMAGVDPTQLSVECRQQLRFVLLLAGLVHDARPISQLSIAAEELANLWTGDEVSVWCLEYELRLARQDAVGAESVKQQILARRPSANSRVVEIQQGDGWIASMRRQVVP